MMLFTLRSMLGRRGNLVGSLIAYTLAVTFMLATVTVMVATFRGPGDTVRFGESDLIVQVDAAKALDVPADSVDPGMHLRVPADGQSRIAAVPGVASVVPVTLFSAQVLEPDGSPVVVPGDAVPTGQAWSTAALAPYVLTAGHVPERSDEVVVDTGIAQAGNIEVGDRVWVTTSSGAGQYSVAGVASLPDGGSLKRQANVFFEDATASVLASTGGAADLVGVLLDDGADHDAVADRIRALDATEPFQVLQGEARGKADVAAGRDQVTDMGALLGVMAGFVGFVTIFVLASTFGFAVQQRRREIGLQRAIGCAPKQVRRAILTEALAVGAVGSVLGLVASQPAAQAVVAAGIWWDKLPDGFDVEPSGVAASIVVPSALVIALLAAWLAGRKTSSIQPIEALQDAAVPTPTIGIWRLLGGIVFLIGGITCVAVSGSVPAVIGISLSLGVVVCLAIACSLLGPVLVRFGTSAIARVRRVSPLSIDGLAHHNTRYLSFRMASVVTPIVLALGMTTMMFGFAPTQETATVAVTDQRMTSDLYLVPETPVLSRDQVARVRDIPGVATVTMAVPITIGYVTGTDAFMTLSALAVDTNTLADAMELAWTDGDLRAFGPGTMVLDQMMEIDFPGSVGDSVSVVLPDGSPREVRWVASADNLIGSGDALISIDDVPASYGVSLVMVNLEDGASRDAVAASIADLRADGMPMHVMDHDEYISGMQQSLQQEAWASNLVIGSAAAFGVLAAINTLVMSIAERQREFALMRMIGATRSQVLRMIHTEAIIAVAIGIGAGVLIGVASLTPVSIGIIGGATALRVSGVGLLLAVSAAVGIVLVTSFLAARSALRGALVTSMASRE